ncbi:DUF2470 domain-containing protein [Leptotrichia hofstadii]|uniref:DUF2470 domain-containing protein n=1 Tax=Leptotrichia hofstadii F0254 TaxID=634994 RepID=C9MY72_9FUSO|nr:DUF2470 domain-containing protein [Leptotrichia hofstadii]EEX74452.1 hypothetical protein GCWU000323_01496 [Leptotrichia hofstadii F0254]
MDISIERILDHMNNDHGDVLPLYVRHFCKREDVKEAKLIDVNEEGMTLLVNGNERVRIKFTKKIDFKGIHLEMIKMAKNCKKSFECACTRTLQGQGAPGRGKNENGNK